MKVKVSDKGNLEVDDTKMEIGDLTQEFLERLVEESLESKVSYEIEGDLPLAKFFRTIDEGTKEGSELRTIKEEVQKREAEAISTGKQFVDGVMGEE